MVCMASHSTGYTYSVYPAHNCCIVYFTELARKKFGRQASFSSAPRNGAQLFPLGFELLEFIGLAARKNETVTFSAWFMTAKQRC